MGGEHLTKRHSSTSRGMAAPRVGAETILVVDLTDVIKPDARKMENLDPGSLRGVTHAGRGDHDLPTNLVYRLRSFRYLSTLATSKAVSRF